MAGAPLSDTINEFLQSVNIPIAYGYGLSETTATVCFYPEIGFQFGSIGEVMPGVQVKIDPGNNEILVKGKTVMSGYYNKPAENEKGRLSPRMVSSVPATLVVWRVIRYSLRNESRICIRLQTENISPRKRSRW